MGNANNPSTKAHIVEQQKQSTNALAAYIKGQFDEVKALIAPERWIDRVLVGVARKKHSWRYVLGALVGWPIFVAWAWSVIRALAE